MTDRNFIEWHPFFSPYSSEKVRYNFFYRSFINSLDAAKPVKILGIKEARRGGEGTAQEIPTITYQQNAGELESNSYLKTPRIFGFNRTDKHHEVSDKRRVEGSKSTVYKSLSRLQKCRQTA